MKSGTVFPELGIKIGSGTQTRSSWFVIICLAEPVVVRLGEFAYPGEALLAAGIAVPGFCDAACRHALGGRADMSHISLL